MFQSSILRKNSAVTMGFAAAAFCTLMISPLRAQDANIEHLLKKLPPPESLVKQPSFDILAAAEALNDPRIQALGYAIHTRNNQQAMRLSDELIQRHPRNPWVHCIHGSLAFTLGQYNEATKAFRYSTTLQPNFWEGYYQLAGVEVVLRQYAAAVPHLQKVVKAQPDCSIGWVMLSGCEAKIGHKQQAVDDAQHAVTVEANAAGTWLRLAEAENAMGHTQRAKDALVTAQKLLASGR